MRSLNVETKPCAWLVSLGLVHKESLRYTFAEWSSHRRNLENKGTLESNSIFLESLESGR